MKQLPETGDLRLQQIVGDLKADPPILPIIPVSRSTWLTGVRNGRYPQKVRLSKRCVAWKVEDIQQLLEKIGRLDSEFF